MENRVFAFCAWRFGFWFRVFGYGIQLQVARNYRPLFSERYGFRRAYYLGPVRLEVLRPRPITEDQP